jgi:hypothetical protein
MSTKTLNLLVCTAIVAVLGLVCFIKTLHVNNVQNLQVIQSIDGDITVRREGGWYAMICPRIWEYPKASVEICNKKDKDAILMQFSNKSTAELACQIGYRIDSTNDDQIVKLHQLVEGDPEKIWKIVQTSLQTAAQRVASQYTPSESVEKFDEFQSKICKAIMHDPELLEKGIDVVSFTVAGLPEYDPETKAQFTKQKEADLAKRLAEAEKIKLEAEKLKVEANYQMQIAEQKGQAEAQMAKDVQSKEREKKMAEIEAAKAVEVAKLEKERAVIEVERQKEVAKVEAEKLFVVAEVQKKTEGENLEAIKLKAEQEVEKAKAKKQSIELSGAITELQQAEIDLKRDIAKYQWEALGKAIAGIKLPQMMTIGTGAGEAAGADALGQLIRTLTVEKLNGIATPTPATK